MDEYTKTHETWNKIANLYEDKFMGLPIYNESYDSLLSLTPQGSGVLDIGCGPGNITYYLLNKRPDLQITGIDVSENMIAIAQKNNPLAKFHVLDSRHILELKTEFNCIVIGFCLPYLNEDDTRILIQNCASQLSQNGVLYLSFVEPYEQHQTGLITNSQGHSVYFYYHQLNFIQSVLEQSKFNIHQQLLVDFPRVNYTEKHTILIAKRKVN